MWNRGQWTRAFLAISVCSTGGFGGCGGESGEGLEASLVGAPADAVQAEGKTLQDFFAALHEDVATGKWGYDNGDWTEDFGDAAAFGAFYFGNRYAHNGTPEDEAKAREILAFNLSLVEQAASDFGWAIDNLENVFMALQGTIELASILKDPDAIQAIDAVIDDLMDPVVAGLGDYVVIDGGEFATELYGPTAITAGIVVIYSQYAARLETSMTATRLKRAQEILDAIHEKAWDEGMGVYRFSPDNEKRYLYPNGTMLIALSRVYSLTGEDRFLDRAEAVREGIVPLKKELGYYQSPYSQEYQGAKTDEYGTLSAQNYLLLGLMFHYQNTGDEEVLAIIQEIAVFIRDYLYVESLHKIVHHWIDGRPAQETDPDFFCSGCNLQVLYILWYMQHELNLDLKSIQGTVQLESGGELEGGQ